MSYKAVANTERARSLRAPSSRGRFGGRERRGGYVHKHGLPTRDEAAEKYEHGTVARYVLARCRCLKCGVASSEYEAALRAAKRGPWQVVRVGPRVDVARECDPEGQVRCRFCGATRARRGVTKHENACSSNPDRGVRNGWFVVHRETGKRVGDRHDSIKAARAECARLNKRDRPKPATELVSAAKVRAHLISLSDAGIGVKSISAEAHVASSVLDRLRRGMILRTRRATEAKILAVKIASERLRGRGIPVGPTLRMLGALVAVGYRKGWIARQLGASSHSLQIGRPGVQSIRGDKARAVKALYDRLWAQDPKLRMHVDPVGEQLRIKAAEEDLAEKLQAVPLSKRDPTMAARWNSLWNNLP